MQKTPLSFVSNLLPTSSAVARGGGYGSHVTYQEKTVLIRSSYKNFVFDKNEFDNKSFNIW